MKILDINNLINTILGDFKHGFTNYIQSNTYYDWGRIAFTCLIILIFTRWYFKKFDILKKTGYTKWFKKIVFLFILTVLLDLTVLSIFIGVILAVACVLPMVIYPEEAREYIDERYGRIISKKREKYYLSKNSQTELSRAMINLADNRLGATIIVAKSSNLDELLQTGDNIGELEVTQQTVELIFSQNSPYNKGALVIRDDKILGVNCRIDNIADSVSLRNLRVEGRAKLISGQLLVSDVVGLAVSGKTGKISLAGRLHGKPVVDTSLVTQRANLQLGLDDIKLGIRIRSLFTGSGLEDVQEDIQNTISKTKEYKEEQARLQKEAKIQAQKDEQERRKREREEKLREREQGKKGRR